MQIVIEIWLFVQLLIYSFQSFLRISLNTTFGKKVKAKKWTATLISWLKQCETPYLWLHHFRIFIIFFCILSTWVTCASTLSNKAKYPSDQFGKSFIIEYGWSKIAHIRPSNRWQRSCKTRERVVKNHKSQETVGAYDA